jgi:tetratricopeptide (TPR) repeat protein
VALGLADLEGPGLEASEEQVRAGSFIDLTPKLEAIERFISQGDDIQALEACDECIELTRVNAHVRGLDAVGAILLNRALVLLRLERYQECVDACDELVDRFTGTKSDQMNDFIAQALEAKCDALQKSGRQWRLITELEKIAARFSNDNSPERRLHAARALVDIAAEYSGSDDSQRQVLTYCDQALARFAEDAEPGGHVGIAGQLARAMKLKGVVLGRQGRFEELLALTGEMLTRFGGHDAPEVRKYCAAALVLSAHAFERTSRPDEALASYNELLEKDGLMAAAPYEAGTAMVNRGNLLNEVGRPQEALEQCNLAISK